MKKSQGREIVEIPTAGGGGAWNPTSSEIHFLGKVNKQRFLECVAIMKCYHIKQEISHHGLFGTQLY